MPKAQSQNICPENELLRGQLTDLVRAAGSSMSHTEMLRLTGLPIPQNSALRNGKPALISLERLIAICRKLGHTITITVDGG